MLESTLQHRAGLQSSGDYVGYRKYATRRLKKLRQRQGATVRSSKSYKPSALEPGQWEMALLLAERSWAASMAAKSALEADAAGTPAVLKNQIQSKLAKAVKHASETLKAKPQDLTPTQELEFVVYTELVKGEAALDHQQWDKVESAFARVKIGLAALTHQNAGASNIGSNVASVGSSSSANTVFSDLLTTSIDPALRLALSQDSTAVVDLAESARQIVKQDSEFVDLVTKVDASVLNSASAKSQLSQIQFRSHTAQVKYDTLAQLILNAQTKDQELRSTAATTTTKAEDPSSFEGVMAAWDQLEFATQTLISEINSTGQTREQDLDIILTYSKFNLLNWRIRRDSLVAQQERGKTNAVRLYDVVLQSCATLAELPGVYNDDDLLAQVEEMQSYFTAHRRLALAELYPRGSVESLALVDLAYREFVVNGDSAMSTDTTDLPVSAAEIEQLKKQLGVKLNQTHALNVLVDEVKNRSRVKGSAASALNFTQIPQDGQKLVGADIDVTTIYPVPMKPVFYDIAYNYLSVDDTLQQQQPGSASTTSTTSSAPVAGEDDQGGKKKGLFGLFKN